MYDSDSDCLSPTPSFQNPKEVIRFKGPNVENSMRLNFTSNSNLMPHDYERRVREQNSRMLPVRRDASPASVRSGASGLQGYSRQRSYYNGSYAQSSVINGRGGRGVSPMSCRSIDSNMSMAATDIVSAFQNGKFNKYELRNIQDAYNKFMKGKVRKRMAKRRNLKLYMKGVRRKSLEYSGSASSLSSDDGRSTYTSTSNRNFNKYLTSFSRGDNGRISDDSRSTKTDITNLKRYLQDSNMYKDRTENFRNGGFKDIYSIKPSSTNLSRADSNPSIHKQTVVRNKPSQRDRFTKSFLLPSQRFNSSTVLPILEEPVALQDNPANFSRLPNCKNSQQNNNSSDSEDILSNTRECFTQPEMQKRKQPDHVETTHHSNKKRKVTPIKVDARNQKNASTGKGTNDFEFAKPTLPARKPPKVNKQKKLHIPLSPIKKLDDTEKILESQEAHVEKAVTQEVQKENVTEEINQYQNSTATSDVSSRPSFLKRKLFTQTLDVTESRDPSACASPSVSPQGSIYNGLKEKNKTRRLATNQSCLSRDVTSEANLLDLIHKIVPPDLMNATANQSQRPAPKPIDSETKVPSDKWDMESMISNCNNDTVSETYTDDEIFQINKSPLKKIAKKPSPIKKSPIKREVQSKSLVQCKVIVEKIPVTKEKLNRSKTTESRKVGPVKSSRVEHSPVKITPVSNTVKKSALDYAHAFWNGDSESDAPTPPRPAPLRNALPRPAPPSTALPRSAPPSTTPPRPAPARAAPARVADNCVAAKSKTTSMSNASQKAKDHSIDQNIAEKVKTLGRSTRVKQDDLSNDRAANVTIKAVTKTKVQNQTKKPATNNNEKNVANNNNIGKKVLPALKKLITSFNTSTDCSLDSPRSTRCRNRSVRIQNSMDRTRSLADEKKKTKTAQKGHNTTLRTKVARQSYKAQAKNETRVTQKSKDAANARAENKQKLVEKKSGVDTKMVANKLVSSVQDKEGVKARTRTLVTPDSKTVRRKMPLTSNDESKAPKTKPPAKKRDQSKADKNTLNDTIARRTRAGLDRPRPDVCNKENESLERTSRQRRTAACKLPCCDGTPAKTRDIRSYMKNKEEGTSTVDTRKDTVRTRSRLDLSSVGLNATVGVASRHCGRDRALAGGLDDDARSVAARSMTSGSLLARARRPKFLHVF